MANGAGDAGPAGAVRALPTPTGGGYDRVPPHNLDAEVSILGAMLLSRDAIAEVSELVRPDDFYRGAHRTLYEAIRDLYDRGEPVDPVTLADELEHRGTLDDVGGAVGIADLVSRVPTAANALYYARIVAEQSLRRRLIDAGTDITKLGYDSAKAADEAVDAAEQTIYEVAQRGYASEFVPMKDLLLESFERIERLHESNSAITGLATGFLDFDELTAGLQPQNLVVIAARPAMGKCLAGSSVVLDPFTGALRPIGEVVRAGRAGADVRVVSLGRDLRLSATHPSGFHDNGVQPVFRLRTRLGREVVATATHPFLTPDGWLPLATLHPGWRVATPRALPFFGSAALADAEVIRLADRVRPGRAAVPPAVFRLPREQVALFLSRLLAGRPRCRGLSKHLAHQVQHLLLRFGVLAAIRSAPGGTGWEVEVAEPALVAARPTAVGRRGGAPVSAPSPGPHARTGTASPPLVTSAVCWDEVVSVAPAGVERVYDLTVPGGHNFVAGDVIAHNSTLVTNIATHVTVEQRKPAVMFSLEMSQRELIDRILAAEAKVDSERLRTGRLAETDWPKLSQAMGRLAEAPLFIDDTPGINMMEIRAKCRRLKAKHGLDLVIVDYLQLMQSHRRAENRVQEVSELSRGLKILAKELDVPVIALSQLSRKPEDRTDRRPQLADLRESGCVTGDTLVALGSGATVPIASLVGTHPDVASLDGWRPTVRKASKVWRTGRKPVFRLTTASGRVLRASGNHPLRVRDGWQALDDLHPGDRVAAPRHRPEPAEQTADADVSWDTVRAREPLGTEDVYDMTVPGTHNFVGNGLSLHNSIEQDSDLVAFIYRDEVYHPDSEAKGEAELILAKHRNGPLRTVRLSFLGHHSRFANMARRPMPPAGGGPI